MIQSGEVATATIHVDFLGDELPGPSQLSLRFEPVAGRRPGNPELTARLFDAATGDELTAWSDRSPFHVPWRFACDATTDCGQTFTVELEVTKGEEVELDWVAELYLGSPALDTGDSDPQPVEPTLTITVP